MMFPSIRQPFIRAALLACTLLAVLPANAQPAPEAAPAQGPAPAPPAGPPKAPEAPSLALGARLDNIARELAGSSDPTTPPVDLDTTASRVEQLQQEVRERIDLIQPDSLTTLSPGVIDSLASSLARIERNVDRSRSDLGLAAAELESRRGALKADGDFLRAVLAVVGREELPPRLFSRAVDALGAIDTARGELRDALDGLVELDGQLGSLQLEVGQAVETVKQVQVARVEGVFGREQLPLWSVLPAARSPTAFLGNITSASLVAITEFGDATPSPWPTLLVTLIVTVALTFTLRRASRAGAADDQAALAANLLVQRPVAVSLLVWTVIAPLLLGMEPPLAIDVLRLTIAALAVWRLLPLLLPGAARRPATGLLALAIVSGAALLTDTQSPNTRLLMFAVGIAVVLFLHKLLRAIQADRGRIGPLWGRVLSVTAGAGQYVAAIGIAANFIGAANLGNQLVDGTLFAVAVPLLLAATEQVLLNMTDQALARQPLQSLRSVRAYPDVVRKRLGQAIDLLLALVALQALPQLFPFVTPAFAALGRILATPLALGGLSVSLLNIISLAIGIAIALGLARLVRFLLQEEILPRTPIATGSAATASRLTYYGLVMVGFFMALAAAGFEISQLTLLVSALGVGIGFGLQNIVNNFVSGIVLAFERPIQPGDQVSVGTMMGRVLDIGLRATTVRTFDGADVIVPNSQFISAEVINWTLSDRSRRLDIPVGVAYGTDLRRVQEVLRAVVADDPRVAETPAPVAVFRRFGESSIDFSLLFWATDADHVLSLTSEVGIGIWEALAQAGISIPFPQRDLRIIPDAAAAGGLSGEPPAPPAPSSPVAGPRPGPRTGEPGREDAGPPGDQE
jgi:potassium-dependent mechanosensitive channel